MKTIEIDDDVYAFLERHISGFGDTPNNVLRRVLLPKISLPPPRQSVPAVNAPSVSVAIGPSVQGPRLPITDSKLSEILNSAEYRRSNGKEKYFTLLAFLERASPNGLLRLGVYSGRHRIYIANNALEIERSGTNTLPDKVPGTALFAATNLSNSMKRSILRHSLTRLGRSSSEIRAVEESIPDT